MLYNQNLEPTDVDCFIIVGIVPLYKLLKPYLLIILYILSLSLEFFLL